MKNTPSATLIKNQDKNHCGTFLTYKILSFAFAFCLFLATTLFNSQLFSIAKAENIPEAVFSYEHSWSQYNDYTLLTLTLIAQDGNYTYAPNQADVYPTELTLYASPSQEKQKFPILFPIGIKKADPLNKSVQIYVYEKTQNIFILFPRAFTVVEAKLELSFLACSDVRCQPLKDSMPLVTNNTTGSIQNKNLFGELKKAENFPWFNVFEERFLAMQNNDSAKVNIGTLLIKPIKVEKNAPNSTELSSEIPLNSSQIPSAQTPPISSLENGNSQQNNAINNFDIDALRKSIDTENTQNNELKKENTPNGKSYTFSPRPLNNALEVSALYKALLFGILAGFILNFMPCVLPVIALKVSAFLSSNQDDEARSKAFREHNIFFASGIITWFMALGLLLGLAGLSWGQLFQSPLIVLTLLVFIFSMGLSLFGIFHLPILDLRINSSNPQIKQNEKLQAFTAGLMATLLATPCSGPLLGAVLGYSLTQSIPILLIIFFSMGFGMAMPYLFFAINPRLIRFMPKAGNWMNTMEQILGFFLMATSVYLLSILPTDWHIKSLIILLLVASSAYAWGKWGSFHSSGIKKILISLACITLIFLPSSYILKDKEENVLWENFTYENFDTLLGKEVLLLKFTADWCPTCKILEQTVFTKKNMQDIAEDYAIRFIYVDLTQFDEEKQELLKSLDSVSIPLLAVFPKGDLSKQPVIIRDLYTLTQLKDAIRIANE